MGFRSGKSSPDLMSGFLASPPKNEVLRTMAELIEWSALRAEMAVVYKPGVGCNGYDPVMLLKLLLLERLYCLSDGDAVHMASDSLSFRAFLELEASDRVPDDTTLVKFRNRLREANLLERLQELIMEQMRAKGLGVREGAIKIIDATLIRAAVRAPRKPEDGSPAAKPLDPDAQHSAKNGTPHYGYKLHLAADRETGIITSHQVTGGATHDSQVFEDLLDGSESEVLADKAYDTNHNRSVLSQSNTKLGIMHQKRGRGELTSKQMSENRSISPRRRFIENTNAAIKRWRGCARAIYRGMARVAMQLCLGVIAHNLMRFTALARVKCA